VSQGSGWGQRSIRHPDSANPLAGIPYANLGSSQEAADATPLPRRRWWAAPQLSPASSWLAANSGHR